MQSNDMIAIHAYGTSKDLVSKNKILNVTISDVIQKEDIKEHNPN